MPNYFKKATPIPLLNSPASSVRTGISRLHYLPEARRSTQVNPVKNPLLGQPLKDLLPSLPYQAEARPPFEDLIGAYRVDGHFRQSVDKYAEKMVLTSFDVTQCLSGSNKQAVRYVIRRFAEMSYSQQYPMSLLVSDLSRRFIRDGSALAIKAYSPGDKEKTKLGGLFLAEARDMYPVYDKDSGERLGWLHRAPALEGRSSRRAEEMRFFTEEDVYRWTYCPEGPDGWGSSALVPAIDDIRSLRMVEEATLKLLFRHLNPLVHVSAPDREGDSNGSQDDIDLVSQIIEQMANDGFIVTGPGYEMKAIGAESVALRAEPYLAFFKQRSFSSLGVSALVMGEGHYVGKEGADALNAQIASRIQFYQQALGELFTLTLIADLLKEGGYPLFDGDSKPLVRWTFQPFDAQSERARQNHLADLFTKNVLSQDETREMMLSKGAMTEAEIQRTFAFLVARAKAENPTSTPGPVAEDYLPPLIKESLDEEELIHRILSRLEIQNSHE